MATSIVILSDGTWEKIGGADIVTLTDEAYEKLCDGFITVNDLQADDVVAERKVTP
jgi:hypothetical protein